MYASVSNLSLQLYYSQGTDVARGGKLAVSEAKFIVIFETGGLMPETLQ